MRLGNILTRGGLTLKPRSRSWQKHAIVSWTVTVSTTATADYLATKKKRGAAVIKTAILRTEIFDRYNETLGESLESGAG